MDRTENRLRRLARVTVALSLLAGGPGATAAPLGEKDTVVLADFGNRTGEGVFDHALGEALALELGQSPFLNVLPDRKVSEALRRMGRPPNERVTLEGGRELCLRTGSTALLGGTIASAGNHYLITLTAVACRTGEKLATEQGEAATRQEVLPALSAASGRLRVQLGESPASVRKYATPVVVTTASLEALDSYSRGMAVRREQGDGPALPFLEQAVRLDPDFPMAYAALAAAYRNLSQPSRALEYASHAYRLRDRVSEREKLHISATYFLTTGEVEQEIPIYEQWKAIYPRDLVPYNNLGNDYAALGRLDESLAQYREALRLVPSVIAYTNVVGMDLALNRLDEAAQALEEAAAGGLDGRYLRQSRYWLAFLRGDAAGMQQQLAWAAGKPGDEDVLLSMQSDTDAYQGRLVRAEDFARRAVESAVRSGSQEAAALWRVNAALRAAELGKPASARAQVAAARALSSGRDVEVISALTLARSGAAVQARRLLAQLARTYPTDSLMKLYWVPVIRASIAVQRGDSAGALVALRTAAPYELGGAGTFINYLYPAYVRGQAYLMAHEPAAAVTEFQKLIAYRGIVVNFVTGALVHLQLARAHALAHDRPAAQAQYREFLALWKDADADSALLKDARAEYRQLADDSRGALSDRAPGSSGTDPRY